MLENRTKHEVTTVGQNLTLDLGNPAKGHGGMLQVPVNARRPLVVVDDEHYMAGIGYRANATQVVIEVLEESGTSGAPVRTNPGAITLTGNAHVFVGFTRDHLARTQLNPVDFTAAGVPEAGQLALTDSTAGAFDITAPNNLKRGQCFGVMDTGLALKTNEVNVAFTGTSFEGVPNKIVKLDVSFFKMVFFWTGITYEAMING